MAKAKRGGLNGAKARATRDSKSQIAGLENKLKEYNLAARDAKNFKEGREIAEKAKAIEDQLKALKNESTEVKSFPNEKPEGMAEKVYRQYQKDGWTETDIKKIWADTQAMRELNKANKGKPKREITSSTYKRAQKRLADETRRFVGDGLTRSR